jgi:4-hydroxy-4-methyl-2-oxoglutarate aldolase
MAGLIYLMSIDPRLLQLLIKFDTPTICNAIEMFGIRPKSVGYMDGRIRAATVGLPPMVGFASTARMRSSDAADGEDAYASLERQLEHMRSLPGPAVVAYQDLDDPPLGATVGEVMCNVYQAFGATGLITSGAARDLEQIRAMKFPLFMAATIASHAFCRTIDVGQTIQLGGMEIAPGDLLHGDENGVTTVPVELVNELPDVALAYSDAERIVLEYAQADGEKDVTEMLDRRRAMGDALAALKRRVARTGGSLPSTPKTTATSARN